MEAATIHTDSSCILSSLGDANAGSGIWYGPDNPRNVYLRLPEALDQTSQPAEIYALLDDLIGAPSFDLLHTISDSLYALSLPDWEATGWVDVPNAIRLLTAASWLSKRTAITSIRWVKGHSEVVGSVGADGLVNLATAAPDPLDTSADFRFIFPGAALHTLSKVRHLPISTYRASRTTAQTIPLIRGAVHDLGVAASSTRFGLAKPTSATPRQRSMLSLLLTKSIRPIPSSPTSQKADSHSSRR